MKRKLFHGNEQNTECSTIFEHTRQLDYTFFKMNEFKHLGVTITSNDKQEEEIHNRLAAAQRCYFSLTKLLGSKLLTRRTKL